MHAQLGCLRGRDLPVMIARAVVSGVSGKPHLEFAIHVLPDAERALAEIPDQWTSALHLGDGTEHSSRRPSGRTRCSKTGAGRCTGIEHTDLMARPQASPCRHATGNPGTCNADTTHAL